MIRELGRGGMGVVYEARHVLLRRTVAVKMMPRTAAGDAVAVARFFAEAQVMAAVKHPNVVEVYEFGTADGAPFLAMELLDGGPLAERLRGGRVLPPTEAAGLVEAIARGVAAAHRQNVVHRDLKPGNVLFAADRPGERGSPKVTDFGLAKHDASDMTASGDVIGTPAYMAPEQASGRGKFVGPAADVWALGVILYEALTGRRPFRAGSSHAVMAAIEADEPPRPRALVPAVPRDLEVVALKCLSKDPGERYATADDLAEERPPLHRAVADLHPHAGRDQPPR